MAENTVKKIATRESYGNSLKELAEEFPNLDVLVTLVSAASENVEHRIDNGIEHTYAESADECAEKIYVNCRCTEECTA